MDNFTVLTEKALKYYVYLLVDPRDGKIFYVGKGVKDRVFNHLKCAVNGEDKTAKLDTIRDIERVGKKVQYYIVRHGLEEEAAFLVESVLIDLLTYRDFAHVANISNIQRGHHQTDFGIKTAEELEIMYGGADIKEGDIVDKVMTINIRLTFDLHMEDPAGIYEATRKSWKVSKTRAEKVEYVFGEHEGVILAIFKPIKWEHEKGNLERWMFEGYEITEQNNPEVFHRYYHKHLIKAKHAQNPIHYYNV